MFTETLYITFPWIQYCIPLQTIGLQLLRNIALLLATYISNLHSKILYIPYLHKLIYINTSFNQYWASQVLLLSIHLDGDRVLKKQFFELPYSKGLRLSQGKNHIFTHQKLCKVHIIPKYLIVFLFTGFKLYSINSNDSLKDFY